VSGRSPGWVVAGVGASGRRRLCERFPRNARDLLTQTKRPRWTDSCSVALPHWPTGRDRRWRSGTTTTSRFLPGFRDYQAKAGRVIPVVFLERT